MPVIKTGGLDKIAQRLDRIAEDAQERQRVIHTALSKQLKTELDASIDQRLNDPHGKIKSWQMTAVGSRGGYAAVRPDRGMHKGYAKGYITNALESGHAIRKQKPGSRWKSRAVKKYVLGRGFYAATRVKVDRIAKNGADEMAKWISDGISGRE